MNFTRIQPIKLTKKTAYLAGVIIGDGHISDSNKSKSDKSKDYRIVVDLVDGDFVQLIHKMISSIIDTKTNPTNPKIRGNRKQRLRLQFRNKSFFYFLTKSLKIKNGAKSSIVSVPDKIKNSSTKIRKSFLAGLFDTDGGLRGHTLGFTTASKQLQRDIMSMLDELSIRHSSDKWVHKKYSKTYYGVRINKSEIDKFLKILPFQNEEKLIRIYSRFNAGMPEWPNGTVDSNQY